MMKLLVSAAIGIVVMLGVCLDASAQKTRKKGPVAPRSAKMAQMNMQVKGSQPRTNTGAAAQPQSGSPGAGGAAPRGQFIGGSDDGSSIFRVDPSKQPGKNRKGVAQVGLGVAGARSNGSAQGKASKPLEGDPDQPITGGRKRGWSSQEPGGQDLQNVRKPAAAAVPSEQPRNPETASKIKGAPTGIRKPKPRRP